MSEIELKPCPFCGDQPLNAVAGTDRWFHPSDTPCFLAGEQFTAEQWNTRSQSEVVSRLEEALKPFAMFALEGKRGGEFIICKGLFADMKDWDDSPPRECHLHKDDFLRARSALNQGADDGQ